LNRVKFKYIKNKNIHYLLVRGFRISGFNSMGVELKSSEILIENELFLSINIFV